MLRIDNKRQVVVENAEIKDIFNEFEAMFVAADQEITGSMYSGDNIKRKFPKIWELYTLLTN